MATKMCFFLDNTLSFKEVIVEFQYVKGLAFSQKQKNVKSFHSSISQLYPNKKILEVSTKSENRLGVNLSAFNLKLDGIHIESIFQSSKVFENNIQFGFLIDREPRDAKKYISENSSGKLIKFRYKNVDYPLCPKTAFYDYIYNLALREIPETANNLVDYDIFTDIEFNEKKQINCQARACAIYAHLVKNNKLHYLDNFELFSSLYKTNEAIFSQTSFL